MDNQIPREIKYQRPPQVDIVTLQRKTVKMLKQLILIGGIMMAGLFIMNIRGDPTAIWNNPLFGHTVIYFVFAFFGFQFLRNQLKWTINIIPNRAPQRQRTLPVNNNIPIKRETPAQPINNNVKTSPQTVFNYQLGITPLSTVYITIIIGCIAGIFLGCWSLDISVTALIIQLQTGSEAVVTNGWLSRDPSLNYHLSLYMIIGCSIILSMVSIKLMMLKQSTRQSKPRESPVIKSMKNPVVFGYVSSYLALIGTGFVVLMLYLGLANPMGEVHVQFNALGEHYLEILLFTVVFIMLLWNARLQRIRFQQYKRDRNRDVKINGGGK